jgi:hypothetical protein
MERWQAHAICRSWEEDEKAVRERTGREVLKSK